MSMTAAEYWRLRMAAIRECLSPEQQEALRRAYIGYPPAIILSRRVEIPDTGCPFEPTLVAIEGVANTVLNHAAHFKPKYVPPSGPSYGSLGREAAELKRSAAELRKALGAGCINGALLRAMVLAHTFSRMAFLIFDAAATASGAATISARPKSQAMRKKNAEDQWAEILPIVDTIERNIGAHVKGRERWKLVGNRFTHETGETLRWAAAEKRLGPWRKNRDAWPNRRT